MMIEDEIALESFTYGVNTTCASGTKIAMNTAILK